MVVIYWQFSVKFEGSAVAQNEQKIIHLFIDYSAFSRHSFGSFIIRNYGIRTIIKRKIGEKDMT